jgi:outer membrane protein OmpA-like peptidoglycan-associated protein
MKTNVTKKARFSLISFILILGVTISSCKVSNAIKGGAIGAGAGGVVGGIIGKQAGNTAVGAIVGAAVGGTTGALIGRHMDKQAEELQNDLEGAVVQRVGEGILITFHEGLQFDFNSYELKPETKINLDKLSDILNKYDDTNILIEGHTDNIGSEEYNLTLSEKRAEAAKRFLINSSVDHVRLSSIGYGLSQPIADNNEKWGRQVNRRVEVAIYANKKMQKAAERGQI